MKAGDESFVIVLQQRVETTCIALGISPEVARLVASEVTVSTQRAYGGDDVYIAKPIIPSERKQRALEDVGRTGNVAEAAARNGISRRTMYRLLKR